MKSLKERRGLLIHSAWGFEFRACRVDFARTTVEDPCSRMGNIRRLRSRSLGLCLPNGGVIKFFAPHLEPYFALKGLPHENFDGPGCIDSWSPGAPVFSVEHRSMGPWLCMADTGFARAPKGHRAFALSALRAAHNMHFVERNRKDVYGWQWPAIPSGWACHNPEGSIGLFGMCLGGRSSEP